ncbi:MAG: hypothetical protein ACPG8W_06425 [Candidatus Promineifilaceae bacterium]
MKRLSTIVKFELEEGGGISAETTSFPLEKEAVFLDAPAGRLY